MHGYLIRSDNLFSISVEQNKGENLMTFTIEPNLVLAQFGGEKIEKQNMYVLCRCYKIIFIHLKVFRLR